MIAVVGGGIAGLTAAYRLGERAVLFESSDRLGGVIRTIREEGFVVEAGPDSMLAAKPAAVALCRELGLDLIPVRSRRFLVWSRGRLEPFPSGAEYASTRLLSWPGKARMAMDLVLPRGGSADESLGSFFRRRMGREFLERVAEPLMAGIFMAPADRLSLRATFPRFAEMEARRRSLILAMRKAPESGASFLSLRGGMQDLVDALAARIRNVRTGEPVESLEALRADDVVLAVPAPAAARLVRPSAPRLADALAAIPHVSSSTVSLAYRRSAVAHPLDGTGYVVPRRERMAITGCTFASSKFEGRAPEGMVLLRAFFEGSEPDERAAHEELAGVLGIREPPVRTWTSRYPGANPVYEVGHEARVREIERLCPPGLYLTGASYRGVGVPDGVRDATEAAARITRPSSGTRGT